MENYFEAYFTPIDCDWYTERYLIFEENNVYIIYMAEDTVQVIVQAFPNYLGTFSPQAIQDIEVHTILYEAGDYSAGLSFQFLTEEEQRIANVVIRTFLQLHSKKSPKLQKIVLESLLTHQCSVLRSFIANLLQHSLDQFNPNEKEQ